MHLKQRTVKGTLAQILRDEILRGDIRPGQRLRQEELAARFNVSTMPIREALLSLEAEGLVTIFPHRGAVVTELSAADLEDIYDIRATLEELATRLAVPRLTQADLEAMAAVLREMDQSMDGDAAGLVELNHRFHSTLYAASNRPHLCELLGTLRRRTQHYLNAYITYLGGMPQAQTEHWQILEACRQGDAEAAAATVRSHILRVGRALIAYVQQQGGDAAEPD
ncbi:MAG: GntR family transcriptional regulator [Caldilineae bacterium]|nr:MAG: GntR family transcriptional regulator [Caldilineae bacterium]